MTNNVPIKPLSAVDCIRPAVARTESMMFHPFRWSIWWRVAMLGMATGEFVSQGISFPGGGGDWSKITQAGGPSMPQMPSVPHMPGIDRAEIATLVTILVVGVVLLAFVHMWVASVARFMLFDAIATGRCRLREGWKRWGENGFRYFLFNLAFAAIGLGIDIVLLGIPGFIMWKMGVFSHFRDHWVAALGMLSVIVPIFLLISAPLLIASVLIKDFAVPIIALEHITIPDALRKLWTMIKANKGDYTIYVLVKMGISIVAAIGLGIINAIVVVILMIPVAVIFTGLIAANPDMFKDPVTIALMITVAILCVFPLLFVMGLIATPVVVFYESYVLNFFGSRYAPLWIFMHPEGVPTPQTPPQMGGGHEPPPYDIVPPEPAG